MPALPAIAEIDNEKMKFKNLTHELNNYNEIFNLNTYMVNSSSRDKAKLEKTNEVLKGKILKLKQEFVLQEWKMSYLGLKNNLMYFSIIVVSLILVIAGLFLKKTLTLPLTAISTSVISVIFILAVVLVVKYNSDRRNLLWDQYYFAPMKSDG